MTAEEEEAHRRKVAEIQAEVGAPKTMDVVFDAVDDADVDDAAMAAAVAGAEVAAFEDFDAGEFVESPTKDLGVENERRNDAERELPTAQWFDDRGVQPPKLVTWFQTRDSVTIEIVPANDDVGYALEDGDKLRYNCQDPPETQLALSHMTSEAPEGGFADDDIIVYTTSITASRQTRDHCRLMENQLYLANLEYHTFDIAQNKFMRRQLVEACGGEDKGLPLLFVGQRFVATYPELQDLVDDRRLDEAIGPAAIAKYRKTQPKEQKPEEEPVQYRVDLYLLNKLEGAKFSVERSTRPMAPADERMLVVRASKQDASRYWPQLIQGPLVEANAIPWIVRDTAREPDSDSDEE